MIFRKTVAHFSKLDKTKASSIQQKVDGQQQRLTVLQDKFIDGHISSAEYQEIISSITSGKLYSENGKVRTSEINAAIALIATIDKGLKPAHPFRKAN